MARTREFDRTVALDKAMRLFWRRGYEATSMRDLVDEMGVGRGSLYAAFGDKRRLFLEALDRYESTEGAAIAAALAEPGPVKAAIGRVFAIAIARSLDDGRGRGCLMVNSMVELAPHDAAVAERAAAALAGSEAAFTARLARAQAEGEIAPDHDPRRLARSLGNTVRGLRVTAKATGDRTVLEDIMGAALAALD